jgi:hypothetical protein
MQCSIDLQFLHCNLPISSQVGLVLLRHLSSKHILVFFVTLLSGVPALFRAEETDFFETEVVGTASSSTVRKEAS